MEKGIIGSLLHQPAFESAGTGRKGIELQVKVIPPRECPRCGNGFLHRHGTASKRRVLDAFLDGHWVYLQLDAIALTVYAVREDVLVSSGRGTAVVQVHRQGYPHNSGVFAAYELHFHGGTTAVGQTPGEASDSQAR